LFNQKIYKMTKEKKPDTRSIIRDNKRKTYKKYSSEEKIRIVLEGLRGEELRPKSL